MTGLKVLAHGCFSINKSIQRLGRGPKKALQENLNCDGEVGRFVNMQTQPRNLQRLVYADE